METNYKKVTQRVIAQSAQISPDFLSHIIRGRRHCPPRVALRLEKVTGISRTVWVWGTPEEISQAVHQYIARQRGQHGH